MPEVSAPNTGQQVTTPARRIAITPEPSEEEAAAIAAAVELLLAAEAEERSSTSFSQVSPWRRSAPWRAATRPRPTPHFPRGVEPSLSWRLAGRVGKPFGR
ncbi:MAG: hypothetical protein DCC49_01590 [Acidobacteria bacterium]|nr:MAG: hypothetical protein DCC49_01590 [Acidobacteriota bacterium]